MANLYKLFEHEELGQILVVRAPPDSPEHRLELYSAAPDADPHKVSEKFEYEYELTQAFDLMDHGRAVEIIRLMNRAHGLMRRGVEEA